MKKIVEEVSGEGLEKKKQTKKYIELDQLGSVNNPILEEIKRHGHFPPTDKPIGWDGEGFRKIFPTKELPFQTIDEIEYGRNSKGENKLIWGDNLAIMRSLPDDCIDLIYIDPPFFSGRNYNLIFGDQDEERTFRDIWDGGLETYLAWLNARLFEAKRLLKNTGSLFVHLDYHAAHYVKVELDKIFGVENFRNELIWHYQTYQGQVKNYFPKKHDNILFYAKDYKKTKFELQYWDNYTDTINYNRWKEYIVNGNEIRGDRYPSTDSRFMAYYNRWVRENGKKPTNNDVILKLTGNVIDTVIDIKAVDPKSTERIGYLTQKPEELLRVLFESVTEKGDVIADFFSGGGSSAVVSQKLDRRWIACDISRVAVQVASDRIANINSNVGIKIPDEKAARSYHHVIQYHGTTNGGVHA
jgi:site-specific DNA-methyltransferase (adenine-specific)/adenine-specific DNA-methyltransferase